MKTRVSAYALAVHEDRLLMTQLAAHCWRGGSWSLPGGGMDHGEQPGETLVREVYEETGLRAEAPELLTAMSYSESDRGLYLAVQLIYRVALRGEPRVLEEGGSTAAVRWVPMSELDAMDVVPFTRRVLDELRPAAE